MNRIKTIGVLLILALTTFGCGFLGQESDAQPTIDTAVQMTRNADALNEDIPTAVPTSTSTATETPPPIPTSAAATEAPATETAPPLATNPPPSRPTGPLFFDASRPVTALEWSPDASLLAVAHDQGVSLYNTGSWDMVGTIPATIRVADLAFSPDGARIALMSADPSAPSVTIWEVATQEQSTLSIPLEGAHIAAWSPDGTLLATGAPNSTVNVWNAQTGAPIYSLNAIVAVPDLPIDPTRMIGGIWFSPDSRAFAVSLRGPSYLLRWDMVTGDAYQPHEFTDQALGPVSRASVPPQFDRYAWTGENVMVIYNMPTGEEFRRQTFEDRVVALDWSSRGERIAVATNQTIGGVYQGVIKLIDVTSGSEIINITEPGGFSPTVVRFSHDGYWLSAASGSTVYVWPIP